MITINDLTPLEFAVLFMHGFNAIGFFVLALKIWAMKKYLRWNKHIYPTMMFGSLIISLTLFWSVNSYYFIDIEPERAIRVIMFFCGTGAIGYAVASEALRLAHKYDKIQAQEQEINHLKDLIEKLRKNTALKVILCLITLLIITGCGSMKKEVERLKNEQIVQTSEYSKKEAELKEKIKEYEQSEKIKSEKITEQTRQIEKLTSEKSQLTEKINQQNKDDISIKGATGNVKITDANGNTYEVPSDAGTEISKKSESSLSRELSEFKERAENFRQTAINAMKEVFAKDNIIKQKEAEKAAKEKELSEEKAKNRTLAEKVSKEKTRESMPVLVWILTGFLLFPVARLGWNAVIPNIFNFLKLNR